MVFLVKLGHLCSIYDILCVFFPGGLKLKQNLEGGAQRVKVWEPLLYAKITTEKTRLFLTLGIVAITVVTDISLISTVVFR
jgi:hypothetical protein